MFNLEIKDTNEDQDSGQRQRLDLKFKAVIKYLNSWCNIEDYEGERNSKKQRQGNGIQAYMDGSRYEGSWQLNLKDGYGEHFNFLNEERFSGYWVEDLRHGDVSLNLNSYINRVS